MLLIYALCSIINLNSAVPISTTIPNQTPTYQQNDFKIPSGTQTKDQSTVHNTVSNYTPNSSLKEILLDRLRSRPSLQKYLDPNAQISDYNGNEASNTGSIVPNIVNNYIILPVEYPNLNKSVSNQNINKGNILEDITLKNPNKVKNKTSKKTNRRRGTRNRRREKSKLKRQESNIKTEKPKLGSDKVRKRNENCESNKLESIKKTQRRKKTAADSKDDKNGNKDGNNDIERIQTENEITEVENIVEKDSKNKANITTQESSKRNRSLKSAIYGNNNILKEKYNNLDNISRSIQVSNLTKDMHDEISTKNSNIMDLNKFENHKSEKSHNLFNLFPNVPVDVVRNLVNSMSKFNDPQLINFFADYGQFYQSLLSGAQGTINLSKKRTKPKRKKNYQGKRRKNKKNKNKKPNNNGVVTSKEKIENITPSTLIKENNQLLKNKTETYDVAHLELEPVSVEVKATEIELKESSQLFDPQHKCDEIQEFKHTDYDSTPYRGLIEDYYPLFIDSAAYNANNNEVCVKRLNDKLLYTREFDELDKHGYEHIDKRGYELPERSKNDYEINTHTYESVELATMTELEDNLNDKIKSEDLQFRKPPHLEIPDFLTRKIESDEIKSNQFEDIRSLENRAFSSDYNDKSSTYSNVKNNNNNSIKQFNNKQRNNEIETVYARSKVVKYGQTHSSEDEFDENPQRDWGDSYRNGDTTYVIAKSLDQEFW